MTWGEGETSMKRSTQTMANERGEMREGGEGEGGWETGSASGWMSLPPPPPAFVFTRAPHSQTCTHDSGVTSFKLAIALSWSLATVPLQCRCSSAGGRRCLHPRWWWWWCLVVVVVTWRSLWFSCVGRSPGGGPIVFGACVP